MPGSIACEGVTIQIGRFPLLRNLSFSVAKGTSAVVSGRSGSGKSVLLELLVGLRRPDRGRVLWDGRDIAALTRDELMAGRQKTGYMFQHDALIANYSVFDNVALPLRTGGVLPEHEVQKRVRVMLEEVALFGVDSMFPESLSAGQQKRAALARALITAPQLLLLDEPLSGIDEQTAGGVASVIIQALALHTKTAVIISHDEDAFGSLAADRYILDGGKLVRKETATAAQGAAA